jgi:hypothetical protein
LRLWRELGTFSLVLLPSCILTFHPARRATGRGVLRFVMQFSFRFGGALRIALKINASL